MTTKNKETDKFSYADESFADIQMLRYRLKGFEELSLNQKTYIYYLSKATLAGRDITTDQFGKYNIRIRKLLESIYNNYNGDKESEDYQAFTVYLKRVWFSNGIHHHYASDKLSPDFTENFLREAVSQLDDAMLPLKTGETKEMLIKTLFPVIFDSKVLSKKVSKTAGMDLVKTSAGNFYENITQKEAENFYRLQSGKGDAEEPVSYGLNSKLVKEDGIPVEKVWRVGGLYDKTIRDIVLWLSKAKDYSENKQQEHIISLLIKYYETGDLKVFDEYSIEWIKEQEGTVDFINGFIEVYDDPLGLKGTWEGFVCYKDKEATRRTRTISGNAQWFEDHSPVDKRFRKAKVKGVTANVVCAAMLGGGEYPSTAIGINLPNAEWIRARYGSKSVTIGNLTEAYNEAGKDNGFQEEFIIDDQTLALVKKYGNLVDDLHTDLHECLGHGSGRLLPGVSQDALKEFGSTIEEARADLFALYYLGDEKLVELGLLPNEEAYKAGYYTYMMNGLMTQTVRVLPGKKIEEAHMQNRALIARWALEHAGSAVQIVKKQSKSAFPEHHYLQIDDYKKLRAVFAQLLSEIQRVKSEGDYQAAKKLVGEYGVEVPEELHREMLERYAKLNIAPYKGFINPRLTPIYNGDGKIVDIQVDYTETYVKQMLRYSETGKE